MQFLWKLVATVAWVFGVILAKGFWSTLFAFFIPFWAWYLAIEHLVVKYGII